MFTFLGIVAALALSFTALSPRTAYRMQAAQFKNPETLEPAGWALTSLRLVAIFALVMMLVVFLPWAVEHDLNPPQPTPSPTDVPRWPGEPTALWPCGPDAPVCVDPGMP